MSDLPKPSSRIFNGAGGTGLKAMLLAVVVAILCGGPLAFPAALALNGLGYQNIGETFFAEGVLVSDLPHESIAIPSGIELKTVNMSKAIFTGDHNVKGGARAEREKNFLKLPRLSLFFCHKWIRQEKTIIYATFCWGRPEISDLKFPFEESSLDIWGDGAAVRKDVGSKLALCSHFSDGNGILCSFGRALGNDYAFDGRLRRLAGFAERPDDQQRSSERQTGRTPTQKYLFFGGIRSPYLGIQVLGIMLVGFGFACLSVFGLVNALDNPNRNRRCIGWLIAGLCLPTGLTFYGWAFVGSPFVFWGFQ